MRILAIAAAGAGLLALAACGDSRQEQAAENIEAATENQADMLEMQADNMMNSTAAETLEDQAEAVRDAGEEQADQVEDGNAPANDPALANTAGM